MINALIMHFQVRDEYGFDPRTAWVGTAKGGPVPAGWPYENTDRFGVWVPSHSPNTRPFTAVDEYLLMKFMYELQLNGMVGPNGWIDQVTTHIANNESTRLLVQDAWTRFTTHPRTPDTDATTALSDGVPDGWELYVALPPVSHGVPRPAYGAFLNSPWDPNDYANDVDVDLKPTGDKVTYQSEFWGTDSLKPYQNATLYYGGMTNANLMTGVVTIKRPIGDPDTYWANKLWPTDPWNKDTDGDMVADGAERAFIYGNATVPGPGGGLNPCSIDTDLDGLPDAWELKFAGTPVAADGTTTLPAVIPGQPAIAVTMTINNGQDGTVADQYKDVDLDGLTSYQEYMTQSIRAYRYDIPASGVTDPLTKQVGQPMDITFQISSLFTAVTNVWDPCRFGWPGPTDPLYWMPPAGPNGYCSTDPNNPDSDYDGMDDYYELYHGLNPLLGNSIRVDCLDDRVAYAWIVKGFPLVWYSSNWWMNTQPGTIGFSMDFVRYPWLNGMPDADPDADGLLNLEEMLVANTPLPENYNTDPSPLWMTDPSNTDSITARFYSPKAMFFWPATFPPLFTFPFEMNEGYDTDNDGGSDKDELITNRGAKSDPRDSEDPLRRQAIWFSGTNSAAVTPYIYSDYTSASGLAFWNMDQAFRSFTVELWARPEWSTNNNVQILIERVFNYGQSDASQVVGQRLRRNFLIGIETDGRIFGGFDNAGGHDEHTDTVRFYGDKVASNTWVHIAVRMDGRAQLFTLFVNGVSQGDMATSLIPATGIDAVRVYPTQSETNNIVYRHGSLTIGAGSTSLSTLGIGIGSSMSWVTAWSNYNNFYRGWIDEVRVWDG
ncbi:MAG: LamG-like jellyroll fold domain-containing protein, partial [Lentisphaerota bacterium]